MLMFHSFTFFRLMYIIFAGRSHSSSSEASTPEAPTSDRLPPPLLRTISEGTYTTVDSHSMDSASSLVKSNHTEFDRHDSLVGETCWNLKGLELGSLDVVSPDWLCREGIDRPDSAVKSTSIIPESNQNIPSSLPSFSKTQASNSVAEMECTQL